MRAQVVWYSNEEGWGRLVADEVAGEIFVHFSIVSGRRGLRAGQEVEIDFEPLRSAQDGCWYSATRVDPAPPAA